MAADLQHRDEPAQEIGGTSRAHNIELIGATGDAIDKAEDASGSSRR